MALFQTLSLPCLGEWESTVTTLGIECTIADLHVFFSEFVDNWGCSSKVSGDYHTKDDGRKEENDTPPNTEPESILREETVREEEDTQVERQRKREMRRVVKQQL